MLVAALALVLCQSPDAGPPLSDYQRVAKRLAPAIKVPWLKKWVQGANGLPGIQATRWWCTKDRQTCLPTPPSADADAGVWVERIADDALVWGRIADPFGYVRALEVLHERRFDPRGKKVLDFGYGNISHLVMLANIGVEAHGVEVDALIPASTKRLVGKVGRLGSLTLHHGFFPHDKQLVHEIGGGYALWLSKNTLKRGYVHPLEPPGAKGQIDVGDDAKTLQLIYSQLAPGGFFFVYHISAAQPGPYQPMADGACPFTREQLMAAGFEVLGHDVDDSQPMRAYAKSLEWAADWPNLDTTLVATYTLARRR